MIEILGLTFLIIAVLVVVGAGPTLLILPKKEQNSWCLISFWIGTIYLSIMGTYLSQAGIIVNQGVFVAVALSLALLEIARRKGRLKLKLKKLDYFVLGLGTLGLIIQLFTHLSKTDFPTTVSMGNLDPISYTTVADYLRDHTVKDGSNYLPYSPFVWSVGDLLHHGYRWGTPMVLSSVSALLNRQAYEVYSLMLTSFFVMSWPMLYLLLKRVRASTSYQGVVILFLSYLVNSTLMYMLYNVFFAQFAWGGVLMLSVWAASLPKRGSVGLSALTIAGTALLYPEGLVFVILPVLLLLRWRVLAMTILIAPYPLFTGIRQLVMVVMRSSNVTWIGWENIRYANLMELLGLYNLNYSRPLPTVVGALPILFIAGILLYSLWRAKNRVSLLAYFAIFAVTYFATRVIGKNFFTYWRALGYSIFLYSLLWAAGIETLLVKINRRSITILIFAGLIGLTGRSTVRTAKQMYYHHHIVDEALVSLREMPIQNTPILTADVILGEYNLWLRLWRAYMLYSQPIITRQNMVEDMRENENYTRLLVEKERVEEIAKNVALGEIIWENEYYELYAVNY